MLFPTRLIVGAATIGSARLVPFAAADLLVTVKPVRHCSSTGWFGICTGHSRPWGNWWEAAGVSGSDQDKIFMAYLAPPPARSATKNVVFITSGQQGSSGGNDYNNVLSGYKAGWSWNTKLNGSEPRWLDDRSLAVRLKDEHADVFSTSDTVFVTVANSMFNHMMSSSTKNKFLTAYTNFLGSHVYWHNVEKIYLAGTSRGGCLVARLAKKLMDDSGIDVSGANFYVNTNDAVCKKSQGEYGTSGSTIDNPVNSGNYRAYKTGIDHQVTTSANKRQMCMRALVGGDEVTNVGLGVRAYTHDSCYSSTGCTLTDSDGKEYYKQTWHDMEHTSFGQSYSFKHITVQGFLDYYASTCKGKFGGGAPSPTPPPTPKPTGIIQGPIYPVLRAERDEPV